MRTLVLLALITACADKDTTGDSGITGDTGTTTADSGPTDDADVDGDGVPASEDCDDEDAAVGGPTAWYLDDDGDGYGDSSAEVLACEGGDGQTDLGGDCDDGDPAVNPGATEVCDVDDLDEDCDGTVDDGDDSVDLATATDWPVDGDGDGYGSDTEGVTACDEPADTPTTQDDCDDTEAAVNPGATEICNDGWDNDCDGTANGCGFLGESQVEDVYALRMNGEEDGYEGMAMDFAGDMNGDGVEDFVLGDPQHDGANSRDGITWIVYGGTTGEIDLATDANVTLAGTVRGTGAGNAVSGGGDYDGDGVADLLIGAPSGSVGYEDQTYLLYGPVTADADLPDAAQATFTEYSHSGTNLDHGDFDGDGVDDMIITSLNGSTRHDPILGGGVHVVLGGARHAGGAELVDVSAHEFYGESQSSWLGGASGGQDGVAAGDVNGDGLTDLLMGAKNYDNYKGRGYLFLGPLPESPTIATDADWMITGQGNDDTADAVHIAQDLDDDGYGDALIGESDAGRSLVFSGAATWSGSTDSGGRDYSIYSTTYPYHPGSNFSSGDLNGDGQEDLLLGDEYQSDYAGGVWIVYGPLTASVDLEAEAAAGTVGLLTGESSTRMGLQVVTGRDVNADGLDDILLGGEYYADAAYLIYGQGL